jgi:stage III sporulation protein AD
MEIVKILGIGFVTAISAILLKQTKPELSFAVTVTGVILILLVVADMLKDAIFALAAITGATGVEQGLIKILLKIVGIGYLTEFGAGILRDFSATAVADKVVLGGKIAVLVLSIPIIKSVLELLVTFLKLI